MDSFRDMSIRLTDFTAFNSVAILVAQHSELDDFLNKNPNFIQTENKPFKVHVVADATSSVVLIRTGIGRANAAAAAQYAITKYSADLIFNIGVVGNFNPNLNIGEGLIVSHSKYLDVDMTDFGCSKGQMAKVDREFFEPSDQLLKFTKNLFPALNTGIDYTCDSFVTKTNPFISPSLLAPGPEDFQYVIADMEIAAIGQVAFLNEVDCVAIKVVSDNIFATKNYEDYLKNLSQCSLFLQKVLIDLLKAIN